MSNPIYQIPCLMVKLQRQILRAFSIENNSMGIYLFVTVCIAVTGCAHFTNQKTAAGLNPHPKTKIFVVILDALQRKTLMESLDSLPNFKEIIKGRQNDYPYIYFENVLVSIPSSSKPSNTTLLTGVYPDKHGVPSTIWFDRKDQKIKTLNSITQRQITDILHATKTDTIFDYARRAEITTMAVATQVAKGVDSQDWIQQSVHLWGQAFCLNLLQDFNPIPDGAPLDRGTTVGLLKGHMYSLTDGLEGNLRTSGDIPDLTVVHFVGMDIFTHYPRRFMLQENWSLEDIQKWYLQKVLDPELGKNQDFSDKTSIIR